MLWHSTPYQTVIEELQSSLNGLDETEVKLRRKKYGANHLKLKRGENVFWIFFRQFHNPLIYILIASGALAVFLGKVTDASVVFAVVMLNTLIGFFQEYRSSQAIQALLQMIPQTSNVIRNGVVSSINSSELVPGDILVLQAGDRVAADIRLLSVKNLGCDESALTGESLPVMKREGPVPADALIAERKCMAYNGTLVTSGTATGIVIATALETEFGKISKLLEEVPNLETPLSQTLSHIARWIAMIVFLIGIGQLAIAYLRGYSLLEAALASIALAVAAIPEGLPATITIAAAIGVQRMAKRKAIIRRMLAVETLGSTSVICTDKTGTLTQNEMTVQAIWTPEGSYFVSGIGYSIEGEISHQDQNGAVGEAIDELLRGAILCNDASIENESRSGDPTELALMVVGQKGGLSGKSVREQWPRKDVIPFESERWIMATLHATAQNQRIIFLKGAPEAVIKLCSTKDGSEKQAEKMASQGMRVIAIAKKELPTNRDSLEEEDIQSGFTLLGLMGMIDPPRLEAAAAIKACQTAGVAVKMITGDHPLTAHVIGRELGLYPTALRSRDSHFSTSFPGVVLGSEVERLSVEELQEMIDEKHVFARALPEHKLKIVEALQAKGHVVAMTGDGVNDSPALKRANIGVAMGITGTAVAKEAADMVLADDNFASIEASVEEGRRVYDNLVKSIAFMFPTNLAQALMIFVAVLFFPIQNHVLLLPILPRQILWINLVVAVALTLPLAFEAMEPDIMRRPPRKSKSPILSKFIIMRTVLVGVIMTAGTIGLFFWQYFIEKANGVEAKLALSEAQTVAVTTLMFFQIFYLFNCRSLRFSILKIGFFSNLYVLLGIGFVILAHIAFVYFHPMQALFGSAPLSLRTWSISILAASTILPIIAFEKWIVRRLSHEAQK